MDTSPEDDNSKWNWGDQWSSWRDDAWNSSHGSKSWGSDPRRSPSRPGESKTSGSSKDRSRLHTLEKQCPDVDPTLRLAAMGNSRYKRLEKRVAEREEKREQEEKMKKLQKQLMTVIFPSLSCQDCITICFFAGTLLFSHVPCAGQPCQSGRKHAAPPSASGSSNSSPQSTGKGRYLFDAVCGCTFFLHQPLLTVFFLVSGRHGEAVPQAQGSSQEQAHLCRSCAKGTS